MNRFVPGFFLFLVFIFSLSVLVYGCSEGTGYQDVNPRDKMFFENPAAFGFNIDKFEKYPYYSPKNIVTVNGKIESLVDFAEENGCSYMQLKEANLWLRDSKLENKAGHSYKILIPNDK